MYDLEVEHRDRDQLDRRLAYALHRLAFEGQVLLTDAWPAAADAGTIDVLRIVHDSEKVKTEQLPDSFDSRKGVLRWVATYKKVPKKSP